MGRIEETREVHWVPTNPLKGPLSPQAMKCLLRIAKNVCKGDTLYIVAIAYEYDTVRYDTVRCIYRIL